MPQVSDLKVSYFIKLKLPLIKMNKILLVNGCILGETKKWGGKMYSFSKNLPYGNCHVLNVGQIGNPIKFFRV